MIRCVILAFVLAVLSYSPAIAAHDLYDNDCFNEHYPYPGYRYPYHGYRYPYYGDHYPYYGYHYPYHGGHYPHHY